MSRPESMSRSDDLEGKKVDLPDMNSKRDKEREEEEERVFIVSTKGRYGPEKKPYTPEYVTYKNVTRERERERIRIRIRIRFICPKKNNKVS